MELGQFELLPSQAGDNLAARLGRQHVRSGYFDTPAFMPVATQGSVKGVAPDQLRQLGAQIILTNTYHLHLRPGDQLIRDLGGVHRFINWSGPILSDSGGYQVFSLSKLRKVTAEGVSFQSHHDGARVFLSPEAVVQIQENLGVDIMMVLDECLAADADRNRAASSLSLTVDWARRSKATRQREDVLMFGIVQGGMFEQLRREACERLIEIGFDGYAVGGLSVGESTGLMREMTEVATGCLPQEKARYLMGVGRPIDIIQSVALGIDMFDCVIPTRSARFGRIYAGYGYYNLRNTAFRSDAQPLEEECDCYACANFSRAYIAHLLHAGEILAHQMASIHNLRYYQRLMSTIRQHIAQGSYKAFAANFTSRAQECSEDLCKRSRKE